MKRFRQLGFGIAILLMATASFASQLAILRNGFSIRHERRTAVGGVTRLYSGSGYVDIPTSEIDHFELDTPPTPTPLAPPPRPASPVSIDQIVGQASDTHRMDSDLINSVIKAESGFDIRAVSRKGAQGLMQLMPDTASNLGITNPFDPRANVDGGTRYLRFLLEKYNYDLVKALAAYNAGPEQVDRYHGVPPYYETQAYVARIVRDYNHRSWPSKSGKNARLATGYNECQGAHHSSTRSSLISTRTANHRSTDFLSGGALAPRAPSPVPFWRWARRRKKTIGVMFADHALHSPSAMDSALTVRKSSVFGQAVGVTISS